LKREVISLTTKKKAVPVMEQPELLKNEPKQNSNWKNFSPRTVWITSFQPRNECKELSK